MATTTDGITLRIGALILTTKRTVITIMNSRKYTADLSTDNNVFNFEFAVGQRLKLLRIGALSFETRTAGRTMAVAVAELAEEFSLCVVNGALLGEFEIRLFAAHSVWQSNNRIVRYKGLWRSYYELADYWVEPETIEVVSSAGVRYAGIVPVGSKLLEAVEFARMDSGFFLYVSQRTENCADENIRMLFEFAFPVEGEVNREGVDWSSLILNLCSLGDLVIRVYGQFDDPDASLDIFGPQEWLTKISAYFDDGHAGSEI